MQNRFLKNHLWIPIFTSLIFILLFHHYELRKRADHPSPIHSLESGVIGNSGDSHDYLSFVDNYCDGRGFRQDMLGDGAYFFRLPGYPVILAGFRIFLEREQALFALRIFQVLFFLFSIYVFYSTAHLLFDQKISFWLSLLYGTIPLFYSYTPIIMTEAVTGPLIVILFYITVKAYTKTVFRDKLFLYMLASAIAAYLTLVRPVLGIYMAGAGIIILIDYYRSGLSIIRVISSAFVSTLPFILVITLWTYRVYRNTGEIVILGSYTHPTTPGFYKLPSWGFWSVGQVWGEDGIAFNRYARPMYSSAINGDTSFIHVKKVLDKWKSEFPEINIIGDERLVHGIKLYQDAVMLQIEYYDKNIPMPDEYLPEEKEAYNYLKSISNDLKNHFPLTYHIKAPLTYFKMLVANSGTSHIYLFNKKFRDYNQINLIRYVMAAMHIILAMMLFTGIISIRFIPSFVIMVVIPWLYIIVLCYFYRSVEQRYLTPILPLLLLSSGYLIQKIKTLSNNHETTGNEISTTAPD